MRVRFRGVYATQCHTNHSSSRNTWIGHVRAVHGFTDHGVNPCLVLKSHLSDEDGSGDTYSSRFRRLLAVALVVVDRLHRACNPPTMEDATGTHWLYCQLARPGDPPCDSYRRGRVLRMGEKGE